MMSPDIQSGQTFDFLSVSGSQTGQFSNVEIVDLATGFEFEVTPSDTGFMMTARTDAVFTGIPGEINDITLGFDTPPDETNASPGEVDVPMLQFEVVPEADGLSIKRLTLKASGTGNDVADLIAVHAWLDENGNALVDPEFPATLVLDEEGNVLVDEMGNGLDVREGDRQIGSRTYDADDGTLNLVIDPPLEVGPRETVTVLVSYDLAGASQDVQPDNSAKRARRGLHPLGLAMVILPSMFLLGVVRLRKRRTCAGACVLLIVAIAFSGCGGGAGGNSGSGSGSNGGSGGASGDGPKTFQVTLTAIHAEEAGSGDDASVGNLSLSGTTLTIDR